MNQPLLRATLFSIRRPPLSSSLAERLITEGYTKLQPRRLDTYRITIVGWVYVEIWKKSIENIVSINRITSALPANKEKNNDVTDGTLKTNSEEKASAPR